MDKRRWNLVFEWVCFKILKMTTLIVGVGFGCEKKLLRLVVSKNCTKSLDNFLLNHTCFFLPSKNKLQLPRYNGPKSNQNMTDMISWSLDAIYFNFFYWR